MRQHSGRISPLRQGWNYSLQASCVLIRSFSASRRCFLFSGPWLPFPEYFPGNHYRPETGRNSFSRSHFTEIQPGHIKVRFSLPAGIPQENQHEEKEDQSPSHFKGIAGYHPLHTDAVAGEGKPPGPALDEQRHECERKRTAQQRGPGAGSAEQKPQANRNLARHSQAGQRMSPGLRENGETVDRLLKLVQMKQLARRDKKEKAPIPSRSRSKQKRTIFPLASLAYSDYSKWVCWALTFSLRNLFSSWRTFSSSI